MLKPNCAECPLQGEVRVLPHGPPTARIAFLGEAPGWKEVQEGQPFVGESGQLLRNAIRACGKDPDDFYFTNVCKCRPKGKPTPTWPTIQACRVTLEEEFRARGVSLIVALGNTAMRGLGLAAQGITRERGRARKWQECLVLPTFHPASLLYNPDRWFDFAEDLEAALSPGGPQVGRAPEFTGYDVLGEVPAALNFLEWLQRQSFVYFDLETSSYGVWDTHILCAAFSCGPDHAVVLTGEVLENARVQEALGDACQTPTLKWAGHNAQFDVARCITQWGIRPYISEDTMLEHYTLDERLGTHRLKQLAIRYLRVPDWEADIKRWLKKPATDSYALIPPRVLWGYNARDVVYGYRLHQLFRPQVAAEEDLDHLYTDLLIPATNALVDLTVQGTKVDVERIYDLQDETEDQMIDLHYAMRAMIGDPIFNPRSPKQVAHWLYDVYKAPPFSASRPLPIESVRPVAAPKGRSDFTTALDQLERLAHWPYKCTPFAKLMVEYRHAQQLVGTYLKNFLPESDGRIHPGFKLFGTVTGRLAGSEPNMLNLPREGPVRSLIIPEEGNVLLAIDYKASELRVLGALSQSERLLSMFRTGVDPHDTLGKEIYGDKYDRTLHREGVKYVDFGVAYGRGVQSIAAALGVSFREAKRIRQAVVDLLGVGDWMEKQYALAKGQHYVSTPTGRRRRFPLILDSNWHLIQRQAVNMPVQGTSSDLDLISLIEVNKWLHRYDGMILFPTHDSLLVEVPREALVEVARGLTRDMLEAPMRVFGEMFPAAVDLMIGSTYSKKDLAPYHLKGLISFRL